MAARKPSVAKETTSLDNTPPGKAAGCRLCHKTPDETEFTKSQQKRLKKGKPAICKTCSGTPDSSGCTQLGAAGKAAKAIAATESVQARGVQHEVCSKQNRVVPKPIWDLPDWLISKQQVRAIAYLFSIKRIESPKLSTPIAMSELRGHLTSRTVSRIASY